MTITKKVLLIVGLAGAMFLLSNDIKDYPNGQWYKAHCFAPMIDNHGNVVVPGGSDWPCSTDLPLF